MRGPLPRFGLLGALGILLAAGLAGCSTKRTLTIDTRPRGARIWVNGVAQEKRTPVEVPYVYPGRFDVRLELPGYESVATEIETPTHIEDWPVVDVVTERLVSTRSTTRVIELKPILSAPTEADVKSALDRARAFQARSHREVNEPGTPKPEPKDE